MTSAAGSCAPNAICGSAACGPSSSDPRKPSSYRHRHVFEVIDRPRRLLLTTTETRLDGSSFDTELEFVFEEQGGKTLMKMFHRGFPTAELRDEHRVGLPNAFAQLERVVSAGLQRPKTKYRDS
jgi:Activator of Hsp90 ATPase homolog 1-like protein